MTDANAAQDGTAGDLGAPSDGAPSPDARPPDLGAFDAARGVPPPDVGHVVDPQRDRDRDDDLDDPSPAMLHA